MTAYNSKSLKKLAYNEVSVEDTQNLLALHTEIQRKRGGGPAAANDTLYDELETRYGGAFAQWVVDRMQSVLAKERERS